MKSINHINETSIEKLLSEYYSDNISESKKREIDELANSDSFLKEAIEGFDEFPEALSAIPEFNIKKPFLKKWGGIISIVSVLIVGTITILYFTPTTTSQPTTTVSKTNTKIEIPKNKIQAESVIMDNQIEEKSIPTSIQNSVKKEETQLSTKPTNKETIREQIELPKIELNPIQFQAKIDYTVRKAKTKAIGYFGFLAVDYSLIYNNTIETPTHFSGTDASKASYEDKSTLLDNGVTTNIYTYKDYLKQTCYLMRERNFSLAISNLKTILKEFPRDANAEFYLGYCYFELKNYQKAIAYFDLANTNAFDFFSEDAQWFKANSLENLGEYSKAQKLYLEIKEKGGYYSSKLR